MAHVVGRLLRVGAPPSIQDLRPPGPVAVMQVGRQAAVPETCEYGPDGRLGGRGR